MEMSERRSIEEGGGLLGSVEGRGFGSKRGEREAGEVGMGFNRPAVGVHALEET